MGAAHNRRSATGYRITKYTSHAPGVSAHLSWGSQITQPPHPKRNRPPLLVSTAQRGPAAMGPSVGGRWRRDSSPTPSFRPAPLAFCCHTADGDEIHFLVPQRRKKGKYSGNESCNTILCVPSVSPGRDKRAGEKLPVYFCLHAM